MPGRTELDPGHPEISFRASSSERDVSVGLSDVMASKVSAIAMMAANRNFLACQPIGIALAVVPLVVSGAWRDVLGQRGVPS